MLSSSKGPRKSSISGLRVSIERGHRLAAFGQTRSGKSYLMTGLVENVVPPRLPVIVIDPKHQFEPPSKGWKIFTGGLPPSWERQVKREKRPSLLRVVVRPDFQSDQRKNDALNDIYRRVFERGDTVVMLEDAHELVYNYTASMELGRCFRMGAKKGVMMWPNTQRPSGLPRYMISEADHIFVFHLRDKRDRDITAKFGGDELLIKPGPGPHDFWYCPPGPDALPVLVHQGMGEHDREERSA